METKNKTNALLVILIILVLFLVGYLVYDKLINAKENNQSNTTINQNSNNETIEGDKDFLSKFVGKYQYGEQTTTECSENDDTTGYATLEIKSNETYTFNYGINCGSEDNAEGNYAINHNKIYLFNDKCKLNENGEYPNCQPIIELNYEEKSENIVITYNLHGIEGYQTLDKIN